MCPKKRDYIGKTEQRLGSRKKQHLNIATKMAKLIQQEKDLNQDSDASLIFINDSLDENLIQSQILELCNISAIAQHMKIPEFLTRRKIVESYRFLRCSISTKDQMSTKF
jgi:hypothetical protein